MMKVAMERCVLFSSWIRAMAVGAVARLLCDWDGLIKVGLIY